MTTQDSGGGVVRRSFIGCVLLASMLGLGYAPAALAGNCTSTGTMNWSFAAGWSGCGISIPKDGDTVTISTGSTVTLDVDNNASGTRINTLTVQSGGVLQGNNSGTASILLKGNNSGDIVNSGTINFGQGNLATIVLNNNSQFSGTGAWTLSVINLNGRALSFPAGSTFTINMSGAATPFTNFGTLTSQSGMTWNFTGSVAQTLPSSASAIFGNVTASNTTGVTLGMAFTATNLLGNLTVAANGILNNGAFAITLASGKSFSVGANAQFNLTGTSTMVAVSGGGTKTFNATSTVNYGGTAQTVTAETYGNLTLSGSGTKTIGTAAAQTVNVAGALTVGSGVTYSATANNPIVNVTGNVSNSGTMNTGNGVYTLSGNLTNNSASSITTGTGAFSLAGNFTNSGTFTAGTGTFTFNGSGAQTLTGTTTFTNLQMNNSGAGLTINNNVTVSTLLTLTNGVVSTGSNTLITSANCPGSISRTSGHIAGNLQLKFATGAQTCTFHLGDAAVANYTPVAVTFTNVGTAGGLVGRVTAGDFSDVNIPIDQTVSVNRNWTLTLPGSGPLALAASSSYSTAFTYLVGDNDNATQAANYIVAKGDSCTTTCSTWTTPTVSGTPSSTAATATGMVSFSVFEVGKHKTLLHNFLITVGTAAASTCFAKSITITAQDTNGATVTNYTGTINITTSSNHGDWAVNSANGTLDNGTADDGAATYRFVNADNGSIILNLTDVHADDLTLTVVDTLVPSSSSTSSTLNFRDDVFVVSATDTLGTTAVAGRSHAMKAEMWRKDTSTGNCGIATGYTGSKNLDAWISRTGSDPGGTAPSINAVSLPNAAPGGKGTDNLTLTFASGVVTFNLDTTDVGQFGLNLRDDSRSFANAVDILGTSSTLTVRPFGLDVAVKRLDDSANPGANTPSGTIFTTAGSNFKATVRGVLWSAADDANNDGVPDSGADLSNNAVTPAFAWSTTLTAATPYEPSTGILGGLNNGSIAQAGYSAGIASVSTLQYTEVGSFTLNASATGYLGTAGANISGTAGTTGVVGRFTPFDFDVAKNTPQFGTTCGTGASSFTYMDQKFNYTTVPVLTVTARNALVATTRNYTGSWFKITNTSLTGKAYSTASGSLDTSLLPATDPVIADTGNGTGTLTFSSGGGLTFTRAAAPVAPFNAEISLAINVIDSDNIAFGSNPAKFSAATAGNGMAFNNSKEMRFGRVTLTNAFGSELQALPAPLHTEYYNGSGFITNTQDGCTSITTAMLTPSAGTFASVPVGGGTTSGTLAHIPMLAGDTGLSFSASGAGNIGDFTLQATLGSLPWLRFDWDGNGVNDNDPPLARISFGTYSGSKRQIYIREPWQ